MDRLFLQVDRHFMDLRMKFFRIRSAIVEGEEKGDVGDSIGGKLSLLRFVDSIPI